MSKNNLVVDREERAIIMSRVFDAPRELVWKICTDPALIPQWWGPRSTTTIVDKMDVRVGGEWRYIHQDGEGNEYGFNGVYQEVVAPERLTYTFEFEPMAGHIAIETITFEEQPDGKTRLITRTTYDALEDLEATIQSGMEGGADETWDRLEELLAQAVAQKV
jgi:uncharacterized protein YndB with AHSA1/START domain